MQTTKKFTRSQGLSANEPLTTPPKESQVCYSCHKRGHNSNTCNANPSTVNENRGVPSKTTHYDEGGDESD